jgi:hypothetical protein
MQNDGGSAFPRALGIHTGMSLRDWFAGQALAGLGSWAPSDPSASFGGPGDRASVMARKAEWAYAQADAMLQART